MEGNPINWFDPFGLDIYTLHLSASIPGFGVGITGGVMYNTGEGEPNGIPDFGIFSTLNKHHEGLGKGGLSAGVSQTLGCRDNFDGTDVELFTGIGLIGGSMGGIGDNISGNESLSLDIGPQLGFESSITHTHSFTIKDLINVFN